MRSVWAFMAAAVPEAAAAEALASANCGELVPNTWATSLKVEDEAVSSSMLAVPTPPTSQPARVYPTQGAGAFWPVGVIMLGTLAAAVSVQYSNELGNEKLPVALVRT